MKDKSSTIRVGNITVASGYKCQYCGVIRPYDRPECFCEDSKKENSNEKITFKKRLKNLLCYVGIHCRKWVSNNEVKCTNCKYSRYIPNAVDEPFGWG